MAMIDRSRMDWLDVILMLPLLPFLAVGAIIYYLLILYWLIRGKDWDRFPLPW